MKRRPLIERFWEQVTITETCWLWHGAIDKGTGYGVIGSGGRGGKTLVAHRAAYELFIGPVPKGLDVDHLCHNLDLACEGGAACRHRRCANPAHLEAVTRKVNLSRGRKPAHMKKRTHCARGLHALAGENIYWSKDGHRHCRACKLRKATV